MRRVLVEGVAPDALALARQLAAEGDDVRLLAAEAAPGLALPVVDTVPDDVEVAYLDVWTAEVDERVRLLRERGARVSCLSDLLLERAAVPTIGVTGTAGKTTTASFIAQLLRTATPDRPVWASTTGRSGNLWATEESLAVLAATSGVHVVELTSSHLAFMETSPEIAVVTCFWPDHLELHRSLAAYRAAKARIVRHQGAGDQVVVNADDPAAASFADETPATVHLFSTRGPVERGVGVVDGRILAAPAGVDLGDVPDRLHGQAAIAAAAAAIAAGIAPEALVGRLDGLEPPAGRARELGRSGRTMLVDDSMAATPGKTRATLGEYADGSVVLVAGGELAIAGRAVHVAPEERRELELAVAEIRRAAAAIVCFGPAGGALAAAVDRPSSTIAVGGIGEGVAAALERASLGTILLVSPMYPVAPDDRRLVAKLLLDARE